MLLKQIDSQEVSSSARDGTKMAKWQADPRCFTALSCIVLSALLPYQQARLIGTNVRVVFIQLFRQVYPTQLHVDFTIVGLLEEIVTVPVLKLARIPGSCTEAKAEDSTFHFGLDASVWPSVLAACVPKKTVPV